MGKCLPGKIILNVFWEKFVKRHICSGKIKDKVYIRSLFSTNRLVYIINLTCSGKLQAFGVPVLDVLTKF